MVALPAAPRRHNGGHRAHAVPVRVVRSSRPRRIPTTDPSLADRRASGHRRDQAATEPDRRLLMWLGVSVVTVAIVVFWLSFIRGYEPRPVGRDTIFEKVQQQITSFLQQARLFRATPPSQDQELNDLRDRVFPEINNQ